MISLLVFFASRAKAGDPVNCSNCSTAVDSYRSLTNIIWSCLATIFLCTWVSLHPNVPKPVDETKLNKRQRLRAFLKDQAFPFVLLLVAPDLVLIWALRQRLMVEYMIQNGKVPTRKHGFFIIMGGFHKFSRSAPLDSAPLDSAPFDPLIGSNVEKRSRDKTGKDHGEPIHPLDRFDVCRLVDDGVLELPLEVEIDDRSKSDWIAKSLVLLQTLWFVVQCIARKVDHLPLTELEVVTLGYVLFNLAIYVVWWDKPQKVARPIRVFCGELPERNAEQEWFKREMDASRWYTDIFNKIPGCQGDSVDLRSVEQTPTLFSGNPPRRWPFESVPTEVLAVMMASVVGGLFGAIHLIALSSPFPSDKIFILWRLGSIWMTIAPLPTLLACIALPLWEPLRRANSILGKIGILILLFLEVMSVALSRSLLPIGYVYGRAITLVLAFYTLSSVPPEALQSISWTNFLPHI
ncbi:hypothetical protein FRC19_008990 [Serendipita sp. 401]|nr:hypothetical protein FRC19_008990 [Serendipita sp. 401]